MIAANMGVTNTPKNINPQYECPFFSAISPGSTVSQMQKPTNNINNNPIISFP